MNHTQMTARVGLFFLVGVALIWVTFEALHDGRFERAHGYPVIAAFKSIKELKASDDVRMAGVKIGSVETTRLANGRAEAVLRINPEVKIAQDSTATISMAGLLGANYVSITIGNTETGVVAEGGQLRTKDVADLNEIMADLGSLGQDIRGALGSFSGAMGSGTDGQGGLFQKLDRLVTENGTKISNTMGNLEDITGKIRNGEGTLGKLVNDPSVYNELASTLVEIRGAASEAKLFVSNTQGILDQIKGGHGTLGTLIYDEESGQNIKLVARNLRELSDKLNNPQSTFGQLISDDKLMRDAQATLRKVDRAVDGFSDTGPITAVGIVAGALF